MSFENDHDPRTILVRHKYFSLRPKPLERWLWQQGLPPAAERVFWLHWEEGMKRGDWCSELSLRQVARESCIDPSTVTRAYQVLKRLGLIRREDPGRDAQNPFQQAIAITEVRLPRELLTELGRHPNRLVRKAEPPQNPLNNRPDESVQTRPERAVIKVSRAQSAVLMRQLSDAERSRFFTASRDRKLTMEFDPNGLLTPADQAQILAILAGLATDRPDSVRHPCRASGTGSKPFAGIRQLTPLETARLRKSVLGLCGLQAGPETFRQVLWSVEEGALRRFDSRLAVNIALKKIREGAWTRPNRMPPNWLRTALPEPCSAA